jgi:predicted peroxiredoxin
MMENTQPHALQVLMASGPESLDRAVLGFAFALSAATCGAKVTIILTQKGVAWVQKDVPEAHQRVNGFSSIAEYIDTLADSGAVVRLCSSCAERACSMDAPSKVVQPTFPYIGLVEAAMNVVQHAAVTVVF